MFKKPGPVPPNDPTVLRRLSFDRYGNVIANSKKPVGRVIKILEHHSMYFASATWDGITHDRRAHNKIDLLNELRKAFRLEPTVMGDRSWQIH